MRIGRQSFISESAVQAILDTLVFSTSTKPESNSLQYLFIVEKSLLDPKFPQSNKDRLYIIQGILADIITDQLARLRTKFACMLDLNETYDGAVESILSDSLIQSNDLLCWSILYYLYVQIDLGLTIEDIAHAIGFTPRTIRRYRTYAVQLLTQSLWEQEAKSRQEYHHQFLRRQLEPFNTYGIPVHQSEVEQILEAILEGDERIIYTYGEKGIGKTTFIKQVLYQLIDRMQLDDFLWINNPSNPDMLLLELQHYFLSEGSAISLKSMFSIFRCIIVLDDADELLESNRTLELLEYLQGAIVFVSSRSHYSVDFHTLQVPLSNLEDEIVAQLVQEMSAHRLEETVVRQIKNLAQGNPMQIRYLVNYYQYSLDFRSLDDSLSELQLNQQVLIYCIPHEKGLLVEDVKNLCRLLKIAWSEVRLLVKLEILEQANQRLYARINIKNCRHRTEEVSGFVTENIDKLSQLKEPSILVSHLIISHRDCLDDLLLIELTKRFWRQGLIVASKVRWHSILSNLQVGDEAWILLAKGVSLKELSEMDKAEALLVEAVNLSGLIGDFQLQAEATLELVKVCRLRGRYKQANYHLHILKETLQRYLSIDHYEAFVLEQAQLALDTNKLNYAITLSSAVTSMEAMTIHAEASYQLGRYAKCIETCKKLLENYYLPDVIKGIIHNLLGRCHQVSDPERAAEEFSLAIEYFIRTFSLRHLCRAQINLATTFIYLEELERAIDSLNNAADICKVTKDVVSSRVIDKNRVYVHRLIMSQY